MVSETPPSATPPARPAKRKNFVPIAREGMDRLDQSGLPIGARYILLRLIVEADYKTGVLKGSSRFAAELLGVNIKTFRHHIRILVEAGMVEVVGGLNQNAAGAIRIPAYRQMVATPVVQPVVQKRDQREPVVQPVVQPLVQPVVQPLVQPVVQKRDQHGPSDLQRSRQELQELQELQDTPLSLRESVVKIETETEDQDPPSIGGLVRDHILYREMSRHLGHEPLTESGAQTWLSAMDELYVAHCTSDDLCHAFAVWEGREWNHIKTPKAIARNFGELMADTDACEDIYGDWRCSLHSSGHDDREAV